MGTDFKRMVSGSRSYQKAVDLAAVRLNTPDLFTCVPGNNQTKTSYKAKAHKKGILKEGQELLVCLESKKGIQALIARDGEREVAVFSNPPEKLLEALAECHGIAKGTVVRTYDLTPTIEIAVQ